MSKIHKTVRLEPELAERIENLRAEEETSAAVYIRVLSAGVSTLEGAPENVSEPLSTPQAPEDAAALVDALQAHVDSLRAEVESYRNQLEVKDAQILSLTEVTKGAQLLHGMSEQKQLEDTETKAKRRGWFSRLFD